MNERNLLITILLVFGLMINASATSLERTLEGPLSISLSSEKTNCVNDPNGSATVTVVGGKSPYSYQWSNGATTATINNLKAGGYHLTVTDAVGSKINSHVLIEANNVLLVSFDQRSISCANQTDGKVVAIPQGGTAPYSYSWNTGSKKSFIEGVGAGMYMVTITDASGCRAEEVVVVEVPDPLRIKANYAHVSCGATADGFMDVEASGGAGNYTYVWELDKQGGTHREGLKPGLYSVTVTDGNGCTAMICPEIIQSQPPLLTATSVPETCPGEGDGRGYISANGDSPPYTFKWPNGESQFGHTLNLTAGTYTVTVTNFRNCSATIDVTVGQAGGGFGFVVESSGIACGNGPNGAASVRMTGGVAPFTYQWINETTNTVISNEATVNNLTPGNYEVMVSDVNGCFGQQDVLIVEKPLPMVTTNAINAAVCFGEKTGSASATATDGEGGFTYRWSNGQTGQTISNLGAGVYTVTATDANGCQASANVTINERPQILINEQVTNLICHDQSGGEIIANVSGGSGNYTYAWSNGATTDRINNILAGTYFLTITDTDGCQVSKGINIGEPAAINISVTPNNAADLNSSDGGTTVSVSGGTVPYTYLWSNGSTDQNLNNIPTGTYTVTVTDANGCQQTSTVIVEATCTLMAAITTVRAANCGGGNGSVTLTVSGGKGTVNYLWSNGETSSAIADLSPGFYGVTVTDGNGCQYASGAFVGDGCNCTQPVLEKVLVFEATCGKSDGSIAIEMKGDEGDFDYQWSNPEITGTGSKELAAGSYEVTITAKNDSKCSIIETINVGNSNVGPVIILQNDPEICNGQKGSATLVPGALTFNWSDGGTGNFRDDLSAGAYLVTVTNPALSGCMDILTVNIGLESGLSLTPVINQHPDCGESNGSVTINVAGGSGNYSYSWGAATHNNLPSGTFDITVTDNVTGCTESILFTLLENVGRIAIELQEVTNVSCAGRTDGQVNFQLTPSGDFIGPENIIITDGKGKLYAADALPAGEYCLIVQDANGCAAGEACFTITEPDFLFVDVTVIPKTCSIENTILLTSSGGNGLYTYDWADQEGEINPRDRRAIANGAYSVTVTDKAGCSLAIDEITINGECFICALEVTASIDAIPECGLPNGGATITVGNSFGNLSYSWGTDAIRTDLTAGTYEVTVTDDYRGCDTTVSFTLTEPELPMEATIEELIVCPNATGKLTYDVNNFRCFKQPVSVTITDDQGTMYDENALPAFGNYIFVVKDADGVEINRQFFSVEGYEPIIMDASVINEGCTTLGSIDLDLATAESNYTIQWEDLTGENQTIDRTALSEGTYRVTITDYVAGGCSVIQTYTIEKNTGITADLPPTALTCDNDPVQVTLTGEDILLYQWSPERLIIDGQGTATPTIMVDPSQPTVTVKATNNFGCTTEKEVRVIPIQTNPPGGIGVTPQCDGLTMNFSSEGVSSEYYLWDFGDGNTSDAINPTHIYDKAGDYVVQLRLKPEVPCAAERGVIASEPVSLVAEAKTIADFEVKFDECQDEGVISFRDISTVNPGKITSWKWDFGNGMTSEEQHPVITLTEDADLEVTLEILTDIGCDGAVSETRSFKVIDLPELPAALQICPGIPTALNPNNTVEGVTYEWSSPELLDDPSAENPIATTTKPAMFTVKMTKGTCVRESAIRVDVPAEQEFELSEDEEVCDEEERLIFVNGPENSKIEWTNVNTGEVIGTEPELMVPPGEYQATLTDENNCPVSGVVAIDNFEIDAQIVDNTDPCEGGNGLLEVVNNGGEAITQYQWEEAEGIISADLAQDNIEVEPSATTDYVVTVKNNFGCEATISETVAVAFLEDMVVIPERDTIFKGEFTPINITPAGNYTIEWMASPSLESMSGFQQIASPEETTTYNVRITDDETGCSINKTVTVVVKDVACGQPNIFFPNAFSPNGDGFNDVLRVRGNAISTVYFAVYNRWGEKVFESNSQEVGWDGVYKGELVSTDVYGYYLKVVCLAGEEYITQGNVTVLN